MKIAVYLVFGLSILACRPSEALDTNLVAGLPKHFRHIDAKMEIPGGFGHILVSEQPQFYSVQVPVGSYRTDRKWAPPDLAGLGLQVWLLRADGTAIPQREKPSLVMLGEIGNRGTDYMVYTFQRDPANDLAGIVMRVKGKLYSREIAGEGK